MIRRGISTPATQLYIGRREMVLNGAAGSPLPIRDPDAQCAATAVLQSVGGQLVSEMLERPDLDTIRGLHDRATGVDNNPPP